MKLLLIPFIILYILYIVFHKDENSLEEDITILPNTKKEEFFYHPVTGYKGTRSEIDAYIKNRERKNNVSN